MSNEAKRDAMLDRRRKKLVYRAGHRGIREMDLMLGGFVRGAIENFSEAELDELERIVELPDAALADWMMGRRPVPPEFDTKLMATLLDFSFEPSDRS